ncbi:MAG: DUF933 domain-containing protein [Fimbriimonadales bacterium]
MKIALIGVPLSGCTTLFHALSGGHGRDGIASVPLPDPRFVELARQAGAKKIVPVSLEWHDDLPIWQPDKPETVRQPLSVARQMDALVCVIRLFDSPYAPYHTEINPVRDLRFWLDEFLLSDMQVIENRLERLQKLFQSHKESAGDRAEYALLEQMRHAIEQGESLRTIDIPRDLEPRLRGFGFLTRKPLVVVANVGESQLGQEAQDPHYQALLELCQSLQIPLVPLCASFERDLQEVPQEERAEFLAMVGLTESRLPLLVRKVYEQLHVQVFYTIGNDSRAWLLPIGGTALDAAGTIHSDLARGFIRAEVCSAEEVLAHGGWQGAQKANKVRLEGRDYVMRDGDVIYIRFNV